MIINAAYKNTVSKEALKGSPSKPKFSPACIRKKHADGQVTKRPINRGIYNVVR